MLAGEHVRVPITILTSLVNPFRPAIAVTTSSDRTPPRVEDE